MNRGLAAVLMLALVSACAAKPKPAPPSQPTTSEPVNMSLPVPVCQAPATTIVKASPSVRKNAADWKAYALKLEQLLGIDHDGDGP